MAQKSKKNHIVQIALPLFLENGFKGTSIDLIVKKSKVSKPTVYNHFPDKSALMTAVIQYWLILKQPNMLPITNMASLETNIHQQWLTDDSVKLYGLIIGEGWRFEDARNSFWAQCDASWRKAFKESTRQSSVVKGCNIDQILDHHLINRLKGIPQRN